MSNTEEFSAAPDGTRYRLPGPAEQRAELERLQMLCEQHRQRGRQVVVVQGLGFVGSAVAAAVSGARTAEGEPLYYVIGVDLAQPSSYWKIGKIRDGQSPVNAPDPQLDALIRNGVEQYGNLTATAAEDVYGWADVILVDVPLDASPRCARSAAEIEVELAGFQAAVRTIGQRMRPDALVLVETTVPVGATEQVVLPVLRQERARRGITQPLMLAHSYERVTPGPAYMDSICRFHRTFAGIDSASAERARQFLSTFIDVQRFPLWELADPTSSELGKLLENTYRAVNIALIHEWTRMAEAMGVNLFEVIRAIRVRKGTHDNMRMPGFGVGGYCLTKDSLLAQWACQHLFQTDLQMPVALQALQINYEMPLHTLRLLEQVLDGRCAGKRVLLCGVAYLPAVGDTRNSPSELLVEQLLAQGAQVQVHDPHVASWSEMPQVELLADLSDELLSCDALVLAVPHPEYRDLNLAERLKRRTKSLAIVDAQDVLSDESASQLHRAGHRLIGVGKGHWRKARLHIAQPARTVAA